MRPKRALQGVGGIKRCRYTLLLLYQRWLIAAIATDNANTNAADLVVPNYP
jgi:hypothetical protein